jgi:hypothetical protein
MMLLAHWVSQQWDLREHVLPVFVSIDFVLSEQASLVEWVENHEPRWLLSKRPLTFFQDA